jgi:hypothetical protein
MMTRRTASGRSSRPRRSRHGGRGKEEGSKETRDGAVQTMTAHEQLVPTTDFDEAL